MKRLLLSCSLIAAVSLAAGTVVAQAGADRDTAQREAAGAMTNTQEAAAEAAAAPVSGGTINVLREKFIEGGVGWMTPILICLIVGLALCIERIISLNLASINSKKLLAGLDESLQAGNVERCKEICRSTRGPIASILYQGLDRSSEGIEIVEKSIVSYGSVQMGQLERGLVWVSLFIALAPMLGFLGTVIGMIRAFDDIAAAGDISPQIVAGGIKIALLTTAFGLIVAVILQIFYNYIVSKIDTIVNNMEDASISFVDMMVKRNIAR